MRGDLPKNSIYGAKILIHQFTSRVPLHFGLNGEDRWRLRVPELPSLFWDLFMVLANLIFGACQSVRFETYPAYTARRTRPFLNMNLRSKYFGRGDYLELSISVKSSTENDFSEA